MLIGIVDRSGSMAALWLGPAIGMFPGFVAGVLFSVGLGIAAGRRRLDEVSPARVVACGGMAGLMVGLLPFVINKPASEATLWLVGVVVIGSMTLLSAASAAGSLALARRFRAERR
jgi:predicted membrane-bound spermidine synthase